MYAFLIGLIACLGSVGLMFIVACVVGALSKD